MDRSDPTIKRNNPMMLLNRFRLFVCLLILVTLTAVAYIKLGRPPLGIDDAHILIVYGKNLAAGQGLVYNPGGERVEGYTSTLWMLVVAGAYAVLKRPESLLLILSLGVVAFAVARFTAVVDRDRLVSLRGLVVLAWVFSTPAFVIWNTLTLMDTALWSALLMLSYVAAFRPASTCWLSLLTGLLLLTRPEGMLWALIMLAMAFVGLAWQEGAKSAFRRVVWPGLTYLLTLAALTAFRLAYFGYPLPNTFYAKVSPNLTYNLNEGWRYLASFLACNRPVLFLAVAPAVAAILLNLPALFQVFRRAALEPRAVTPRLRFLLDSLWVAAALVAPVLTGGDHFVLFRFYQPVWGFLILPALGLAETVQPRPPRWVAQSVAVLVLAVALWAPLTNWFSVLAPSQMSFEFFITPVYERTGQALKRLLGDPLPRVGVILAGAIKDAYPGDVIDLVGLNNVMMAHAGGDNRGLKNHAAFSPAVFFAQKPDVLLPMAGSRPAVLEYWQAHSDWHNYVLKDLLRSSQFQREYALTILEDAPSVILAYTRRDYLARVTARGIPFEVLNPVTLRPEIQ